MRRIEQSETFHGTGAAQTEIDLRLAKSLDLSERQSQVAALLRVGMAPSDLTSALGISSSTAEKHLAALREKTSQPTTLALCAYLTRIKPDAGDDAFHLWQPVLPPEALYVEDGRMQEVVPYSTALQSAPNLRVMLVALRDHLREFEVRHIYYAFVPLSVRGFLANDLWDLFLAPPELQTSFQAHGGLMSQPMALQLFNNPGDLAYTSYDDNALAAMPSRAKGFGQACRDHGAKAALGFGFPVGGGFCGFAMTMSVQMSEQNRIQAGSKIRAAGMLMHGAAGTNGTLAALADLSVRERDALSALARGLEAASAAAEMKISPRAFSKLIAQSRKKLKSKTTNEAIYKASALNALVFL